MAEETALHGASGEDWRKQPVDGRPGFLIRRVQQVHTALFSEETGAERITPIMYSVLSALGQSGPLDQMGARLGRRRNGAAVHRHGKGRVHAVSPAV